MFREMRRKEKELDIDFTEKILNEAHYGVIAIPGEDGYPYAVPINFAYHNGGIVFHGAKAGYKFDLLQEEKKVSFTAVLQEEILPDKFDSTYLSVIGFGRCKSIEDEEEKKKAALTLIQKYSKDFINEGKAYIDKASKGTAVYFIKVDHMTAKEGK